MEVLHGTDARIPRGPTVLTVGTFDGVHRGHRALHERVVVEARRLGAVPALVTFDRHPLETIAPEKAPCRLTTLEQRLELLEAIELEAVLVLPFTAEVAALSPERFVRRALVDAMEAKKVVVGGDFRFGHDRAGDVPLLEKLGAELGFEVETVSLVEGEAGEKISSSRIRRQISEGAVEEAAQLLGRAYRLAGVVRRGEGRGAKIGFPTANVEPDALACLPATGVYAGRWAWRGRLLPGVVNVGVRPTFERAPAPVVEIHIFGVDEELYGERGEVEFVTRLRDEQRFASVEELVRQIRRDAEHAAELLGA